MVSISKSVHQASIKLNSSWKFRWNIHIPSCSNECDAFSVWNEYKLFRVCVITFRHEYFIFSQWACQNGNTINSIINRKSFFFLAKVERVTRWMVSNVVKSNNTPFPNMIDTFSSSHLNFLRVDNGNMNKIKFIIEPLYIRLSHFFLF